MAANLRPLRRWVGVKSLGFMERKHLGWWVVLELEVKRKRV